MLHDLLYRIPGVEIFASHRAPDRRGSLSAYVLGRNAVQWNLVRSPAGVLRGMHAHSRYDEFYIPIAGRFRFALIDSRVNTPTFGTRVEFEVSPDEVVGFRIPIGVTHGALFLDDGVLGYGLSAIWDGSGEYVCRWNDPALGFDWPVREPLLSDRDATAPSYEVMVAQLNRDL
ncbi:MAG: dTDP-4-dehydrorhamnose 3,5-epimerase family protein [Asticcacaulis sp.]|nr:dTDP-4-dehydrorhamnose 3,5-epimerase family protein [Asticcacaulis sp.]